MTDGDRAPLSLPPSLRWHGRPPLCVETGLAGHVIVVLFWRLGCVHSREALIDMAQLAGAYAGRPVAIVACHVPTESAERDDDRLARMLAALPHPITVAIAEDRAWLRQQQVTSLPALLLADDRGVVRYRGIGVPQRSRLREAVDALLADAADGGRLADPPFVPICRSAPPGLLPTAVAADDDRIWLASAGLRRVLALDLAGNVTLVVGSGVWGADDGAAATASFALPAALCVHEDHVVVADAGTHTLRAIDRETGEVTTWCGTGRRSGDLVGGGYGRDQSLSSPSGLLSRDGGLYVSEAGTHQLWQVDPMTGAAMAWLGDGRRGGGDGGDGGDAFCEPLGLAQDDTTMWVAEAGGELAAVDLAHVQRTTLLSGLRRPAAVAAHGDRLLVAAAWQPAVQLVAMDGGRGETLFDGGNGLIEPVALSVEQDRLMIVDTGADAVFVANLAESAPTLGRLEIQGLPEPAVQSSPAAAVLAEAVRLREHSDAVLRVAVPAGATASGGAWSVDVVDEAVPTLACARHAVAEAVDDGTLEVLLPVAEAGVGALRLRLERDGAIARYVVPVVVAADGAMTAVVRQA